MPWSTPSVSELRTAFVHAVRTAKRPVATACRDFRISRKTAYKWLARFDAQEPLGDRSRKPAHSPTRSSEALENAVLAVREEYGPTQDRCLPPQPPPTRTARPHRRRHPPPPRPLH